MKRLYSLPRGFSAHMDRHSLVPPLLLEFRLRYDDEKTTAQPLISCVGSEALSSAELPDTARRSRNS